MAPGSGRGRGSGPHQCRRPGGCLEIHRPEGTEPDREGSRTVTSRAWIGSQGNTITRRPPTRRTPSIQPRSGTRLGERPSTESPGKCSSRSWVTTRSSGVLVKGLPHRGNSGFSPKSSRTTPESLVNSPCSRRSRSSVCIGDRHIKLGSSGRCSGGGPFRAAHDKAKRRLSLRLTVVASCRKRESRDHEAVSFSSQEPLVLRCGLRGGRLVRPPRRSPMACGPRVEGIPSRHRHPSFQLRGGEGGVDRGELPISSFRRRAQISRWPRRQGARRHSTTPDVEDVEIAPGFRLLPLAPLVTRLRERLDDSER